MTHTYSVQGMTCNGCRNSVEQKLSNVDGVKKATVDLASETADVVMERYIDTSTLQAALPEKYTINKVEPKKNNSEKNIFESTPQENESSKFQQLKPLFLIFGFIVLLVTAKNYGSWEVNTIMLDFMGVFFLTFSLFKFFDLKGFASSFSMYDPLAKVMPAYGKIYPFLEVILGFFFLARLFIPFALIATLVILSITTIGVTRALFGKQQIQCACLGTVLKLPMTEATFIENAIMIGMSLFMIFNTGIL